MARSRVSIKLAVVLAAAMVSVASAAPQKGVPHGLIAPNAASSPVVRGAKEKPDRKVSGGLLGVPWKGSRQDFARGIPGILCSAPISCRGGVDFHGVPVAMDIVWGGFSPVVTSATLKFERRHLQKMKRILISLYGDSDRSYVEDGERVTEWRLPDVLINLDHGSDSEGPQVYMEPKR